MVIFAVARMSTNFSVVFCASICKNICSAKNNVNFYDNDLRPWLTNPAYNPGLWPPVHNPWLTTHGSRPLFYDPGSPLIHDPWLMTQGSWLPAQHFRVKTPSLRPPAHDPRLTTPCSRPPAHYPMLTITSSQPPANDPLLTTTGSLIS